jgi:UDP-N-acetylglucosamine--N-acetylmuramyl-(pentapeptide) pyrophosphoryl-undecaprenol N-acetylglucosamine transferase
MKVGPVMIMAGGTGGHIFPGLAVADVIREREHSVVWLGTHAGLEATLVPGRGYDIEWITISGLRGRGPVAWVATPFNLARALFQALVAFRRRRPSVVLGMGGFVSGPGGLAARLTGRPLVVHEQNAVAGTTNRVLARYAKVVFEAFPGTFPERRDTRLVGNPVRREIEALDAPEVRLGARRDGPVQLLVLGGSQGARVLNTVVPAAIGLVPEHLRPRILHQTGRSQADAARSYAQIGADVELTPFIEDIAAAYSSADLVVARAGALTVAELEAAGLGAILIPYPYAIDDHQMKNAQAFCVRGAGIVIPESACDARTLAATLEPLLAHRERLLDMAQTARAQARTGAAVEIASACLALAGAGT